MIIKWSIKKQGISLTWNIGKIYSNRSVFDQTFDITFKN